MTASADRTTTDYSGKFIFQNNILQFIFQPESDVEHDGMDRYDYGARFYDAALGRFHSLDPRAEIYNFQSPFVYASNNPISNIDVNGEFAFAVPIAFGVYEAVVALTAAAAITTTAVAVDNMVDGTHTSIGTAPNYGESTENRNNRNMQNWGPKAKLTFGILSGIGIYQSFSEAKNRVKKKTKSNSNSNTQVSPTLTDPLYVSDPEYWNQLEPNQKAGYMTNLLNNLVTNSPIESTNSSTITSTNSLTTTSTSSSTTTSTNSSTTTSTNNSTTTSTNSSTTTSTNSSTTTGTNSSTESNDETLN